jgi:hypothetical protein
VFDYLGAHDLKLHPRKFSFFKSQVEYLGHVIYQRGLRIQRAKVDVISKFPKLIDDNRLKVFLGLANYYQWFVKGFNHITKPT